MNSALAGLQESTLALASAWGVAAGAADELDDDRLIAVNEALATLRRHTDAVHARVAHAIARRSSADLGPDSLVKKQGYRNPAVFIAATTGTSVSDAGRLLAVGQATAPRPNFCDEPAPPRYVHVAAALKSAAIGMPAAAAITAMLDRVAVRTDAGDSEATERDLVEQASKLSLDQLTRIIVRAESNLMRSTVELSEAQRREDRELHIFERAGMVHIRGQLDPVTGAPVKAAIEALVTAEFRNTEKQSKSAARSDDAPRRTVPQMQADALALLATHALGCGDTGLPLDGATVVVRIEYNDLISGVGLATVDGMTQPISAATARHMAASGRVIPFVMGGSSEILDWGREKRLFTRAQKLALVERDGGCAMCGLPPGMTKAHHLRWWARDAGPTDLANGVLLCESCHHRIHDNGWDIRIDGVGITASVWFVPPPDVDRHATPRLGGRARFDYAA